MVWRGGEQQIAYLVEALQESGHEVMVVCKKGSAFESYCQQEQIPYESLSFRNSLDLGAALALKKICKTWQPDLMHVHSSKSNSIAWMADLFGNRVPYVLSRRVVFSIKNNLINRHKYNHPRLKKIISVTKAVSQQVLPLLRQPDRSSVVFSGIDTAAFPAGERNHTLRKQFDLADDAFLIGTAAAFTAEKDYTTFLKVAALVIRALPDQPIYFIAIGEGVQRAAMQELARQHAIEDKVVFTGFIPNAKRYFSGLDLFLFTSRSEGIGGGILDAFASRIPVVSTAAGGIPEIVHHEKTGLLAPVGDSQALANAVIHLYKHEALREEICAAAYELVQHFDKKSTTEKTIAIYQEVLYGHAK